MTDTPTGPRSLKAIFWGSLIDIGGSLLAGAIVGIVLGVVWVGQGIPAEEVAARMQTDSGFLWAALVLGLLFTALGGFVAGRIAPDRKLLHAAITAIPCVALGLATAGAAAAAGQPAWFRVASYLLVIPAAVLGGMISQRGAESRA